MWGTTQKMGPIGSAVLTFIWYTQAEKQSIFREDTGCPINMGNKWGLEIDIWFLISTAWGEN